MPAYLYIDSSTSIVVVGITLDNPRSVQEGKKKDILIFENYINYY